MTDDTEDFWDKMAGAYAGEGTGVDEYLQGTELHGDRFSSLQALTDQGRAANALPLPQVAGTRVRFIANLGSVLTYDDVPDPKIAGTVVTVKTAEGPKTDIEGRVFVAWDDGKFRPILAEHLRLSKKTLKQANSVRMVLAGDSELTSMFMMTASGDELVHKATKDLWALEKNSDGNLVINRLFKETGEPLKV